LGVRLLAPLPKRKQHLQQVSVINHAVPVEVVAGVAPLPELEQHAQQVGVIDAAVAVVSPTALRRQR